MSDTPNSTVYISNLYEKLKKDELKRCLYAIFSQFGKILDVVCMRTYRLRGQAWVVFSDVTAATNALTSMQGFPFFDKPMVNGLALLPNSLQPWYTKCLYLVVPFAQTEADVRPLTSRHMPLQKLAYAHGESDASARAKGKPLSKADRHHKASSRGQQATVAARTNPVTTSAATSNAPKVATGVEPPNKILFVQNLPTATNSQMLSMLFQQFPGFKEVRMVDARPGISFVEFDNDMQASVAMTGLQAFKITPSNAMDISYAKQ